jgi:uncharacterized membrane protein YecN with MAPEG domain
MTAIRMNKTISWLIGLTGAMVVFAAVLPYQAVA